MASFWPKKSPNFFACSRCVINVPVYIWHHFEPPKNKIVFACGGLCKKCVYIVPFCPPQKQNCFGLRRAVQKIQCSLKNFPPAAGQNQWNHLYHKTCITSRNITFSNQTTKCVHMASFRGKKLKIKNLKKTKNNQGISLQITPLKITPPSFSKNFRTQNFLLRKSSIKKNSKDNPPLSFPKKSSKGGVICSDIPWCRTYKNSWVIKKVLSLNLFSFFEKCAGFLTFFWNFWEYFFLSTPPTPQKSWTLFC